MCCSVWWNMFNVHINVFCLDIGLSSSKCFLPCSLLLKFVSRRTNFALISVRSECYLPCYLTIIPRAQIGSESTAHEAEDRMGYWLRGYEGERNNCFSKIQIVGKKYGDKTTLASKTRFSDYYFGFQSRRFSLLMGYNIKPSSSSTNQNATLMIDHTSWILLNRFSQD